MESHEMLSAKTTEVHVVEEKGDGANYADAYAGPRTDGTRNTATRVRRVFSFAQIYFFALTFMNSWEAMATGVPSAFWNGGPYSMVWGFFIVFSGVLCQVASMAELSSVQPIAGAQYHWTYYLAPPKSKRFITWIQGWITWFSWVSILAGVVNIAAVILVTLVSFNNPSYVAHGWHVTLVMYAMLIVFGLVNQFIFWIIPWVELVAGLLHIILWIVFASVLLTLGSRHSSEFVWTGRSQLSGWENPFVGFNLGALTVTWGFVGFDGAVHMSEEVRKARHAVPRAMFWSIVMNGILAFGMILVFMYCLGDVDEVLTSSYSLMTICVNATQSLTAGTVMVSAFEVTVIAVSLGSVSAASRLTWAWARDGALPAYFAHIDTNHRVPTRSVWLPIVIVMLLALLNIGSSIAFSVVIALSTFGLYQSYFIAIGCMLYARLNGKLESGGWSLGRFGFVINIWALLYTAWFGIFLVFPAYLPITAAYMNYALPINAFAWLVTLALWFGWGKKNWKGLNKEVVDIIVADSDRNTKD